MLDGVGRDVVMRKLLWLLVAAGALAISGTGARDAFAGSVVVNTASDHAPDGVCDTADCTFREAIQAVEASQTIAFNIDGDGPHIIQLSSAMDGLFRQSVTIDGYTQPGAAPNTAAAWTPGNADIRIALDGSTIPGGQDSWGLWLSAKNLTIRGLSFVNFDDEAIKFATFPSAAIKGNYIGLYPAGQLGPNAVGITLRSSEPGNLIGGYMPADRNVISGNTGAGLAVTGSSEVAIAGNFVGTDASGSLARPNGGNGIDMKGGPESTIGGALNGSGNLVSGNAGNGIAISTSDGHGLNVKGNRIGTTADGESPLPNQLNGVYLAQDASGVTIGGEFNPREENIIAFNAKAGVSLAASAGTQNYIDPNKAYSNGGLGSDLLDDGAVLENDTGDGDTGPNNRMNYPVMTSIVFSGTKLTVDGYLDTVPMKFNNMFFFANAECDPSGYGEGELFLGSYGINSGQTGIGQFQRVFTSPALGGRGFITMSASDPESSSEFSRCLSVDIAPDYNCDNLINQGDPLALVAQLATGDRGPSGANCTEIGVQLGDGKFGDPDCDGQLTPRDALVLMIALAGADQLPLPQGCSILLPS